MTCLAVRLRLDNSLFPLSLRKVEIGPEELVPKTECITLNESWARVLL